MPAPVTLDCSRNPIQSGIDWSLPIHVGVNEKNIDSYSAATPVVITINQHGYTTGQKKWIFGCQQNKSLNNNQSRTEWAIVVIDANTFSLTGSTGVASGTNEGVISDSLDATGCTIYVVLTSDSVSNAVIKEFSNVTPTSPILSRWTFTGSAPSGAFTWIQQTTNYFKLALIGSATKTLADSYGSLFGFYVFVDSAGISSEPMYLQIPIQP